MPLDTSGLKPGLDLAGRSSERYAVDQQEYLKGIQVSSRFTSFASYRDLVLSQYVGN
jgi:hypothetical protein